MKGRVLFITGEYPPMRGGIGDYTERLVRALEPLDWEARVLTSREVAGNPDDRVLGWAPDWAWGITRLARRAQRQSEAAIVHIQYQTAAFAMHPAVNLLAGRLSDRATRVVTTFHDRRVPYLFPKAGPVRTWINSRLARGSDAVVVTNEADRLALGQDPGVVAKLTTIPIGSNLPEIEPIDCEATRAWLGVQPGEFVVGFFGFLTEDKGVDLLVAALEQAADRPVRLVIIGGGLAETDVANADYHRWLMARLHETTVPVLRTGHLSAEDAARALRAVDLIALPFRQGASLRRGTLIAALRSGVPVISTDPGDAGSLTPLRSGESLWLVQPGEAGSLAEGLRTLIRDEPLRRRLAENARAAATIFDWPVIARQHAQLYAGLLEAGDADRVAE